MLYPLISAASTGVGVAINFMTRPSNQAAVTTIARIALYMQSRSVSEMFKYELI